MEAHNEEPVELDALKRCLQIAVQFDMKILDANSRVSRMLDNLMRALKIVVTKLLQLQRNKVLKADVFRFIKWLRQFVVGYQLYGGVEEEKPAKAPVEVRPRSEQRQISHGYSRSHGSNDRKPNVAPTVHGALKTDKEVGFERPKVKCLKCQSTEHRVREHPGITDDEVKKLIDEFYASRRGVNAMKNSDKSNSMECRATLDDVLVLPRVLLDSGSDESLVSNGLLQALERLELAAAQGDAASAVQGADLGDVHWTRGLKAWVDEQSPQINLLIGRPVMERLGFSVDGMLVDALKKRQTWEVGDLGDGEDAYGRRIVTTLKKDG
ncbi:hypothetical protein DYB32_008507 [Aphanomyces invadans]|uniref:Peptidase A2 domain-containing protein n=1 Tax=Aphanomyces invadans TaxID=157072 RepID=A0A3R6ZK24_9STRA|nr:hypothetical protein DYB32_008507 [Aphanomyces invadans]